MDKDPIGRKALIQAARANRLEALALAKKIIDAREWKTPKDKTKAISRAVGRELKTALIEIFESLEYGAYIKIPDLLDGFPAIEEKRMRSSIGKVRKHFLSHGKILANHPGIGYRLDVPQDIPIETCKSMLRALANLISGKMIIEQTREKQKELDPLAQELIEICYGYAPQSIQPLRDLSAKIKDHPLYGDIFEQLQDLETARDISIGEIKSL